MTFIYNRSVLFSTSENTNKIKVSLDIIIVTSLTSCFCYQNTLQNTDYKFTANSK